MAPRIAIACSQALTGALLLIGIWLALPARWWPVDVAGTLLGAGALLVTLLLALRQRLGPAVARIVLWAELVLGSLAVTLLAASIAQLAGSYGPVGSGGALLMGTIGALIVPYLIGLPVLQLFWLRRLR
jgi:hypothetical protein